MKKRILVICDLEAEYAFRLAEVFEQKKELPFEVQVFSEVEELLAFCSYNCVETILISEAAYCSEVAALSKAKVIILSENGNVLGTNDFCVDKYQSAENILKEVMCYYAATSGEVDTKVVTLNASKIIGLYSPVKRSLQTSFGLTLGQLMARKEKVLYLNFESYSGFEQVLQKEFCTELADLLYFMKHTKGKLLYRVESMVEKVGELETVPPICSPVDMQMIPGEDWKELLIQLCERCKYDVIILDLSDSMRGLFEILRMCEKVYTPIQQDHFAKAKLAQYESLLETTGYKDVLQKTEKLLFPQFRNLPEAADRLAGSELGEYICKILKLTG